MFLCTVDTQKVIWLVRGHMWLCKIRNTQPGTPSGLTSCFAPSGVARILTHEAGITDIVVLQVTPLVLS